MKICKGFNPGRGLDIVLLQRSNIYIPKHPPKKLYSLLAPPLVLHPDMIDFCVFIVLVLLTIFLYLGKSLFLVKT